MIRKTLTAVVAALTLAVVAPQDLRAAEQPVKTLKPRAKKKGTMYVVYVNNGSGVHRYGMFPARNAAVATVKRLKARHITAWMQTEVFVVS